VEVDVNGIETNEEVDEDFLLLFRYVVEKGPRPDLSRRERGVNADIKPKGFGIDVANIDTTFMGEENRIALTVRVDADVELGICRMRKEWLQDEVVECSSY
jgi:hypothetical protein